MADNIMMPSSSGGLMRFNDEYTSKFQIAPEHVIILIAIIIVGMTVLKLAF